MCPGGCWRGLYTYGYGTCGHTAGHMTHTQRWALAGARLRTREDGQAVLGSLWGCSGLHEARDIFPRDQPLGAPVKSWKSFQH